jgi:hypothetical protein
MKRKSLLVFIFFILIIKDVQSINTIGIVKYDWNNEIQDSSVVDFSKLSRFMLFPNGTKNYSKIFINELNSNIDDPFKSGISRLSGFSNNSIRGYESKNFDVTYDGIILNSFDNTTYYFPSWTALLSINKALGESFGHNINRNLKGDIFGTYELTSPQSKIKRTSFSWISANHLYRNSFQAMHSTGEMTNGWSITLSGSGSWANQGYIESTAIGEWSYLLAVNKIINTHTLSFTVMGAPVRFRQSDYAPKEAFNLRKDKFYSPNWGNQEGKIRNSNQFTNHLPIGILNHSWMISGRLEINSSIAYSQGSSSFSELEWNDALNPNPTYYSNMPSYYSEFLGDEATAEHFTNNWLNNPDFYQINWSQLYFENRKNLYQIDDVNGIAGKSIIGNQAKYFIALNNQDVIDFHFASTIKYKINSNLKFTAGVYSQVNQQHFFKTMDDLLGADFHFDALNAVYFLPEFKTFQSDLNITNRVVYEGETFGYNYIVYNKTLIGHTLVEYKLPRLEFIAFGSVGARSTKRDGQMKNEAFKTNSLGSSETFLFGNFNFRGEVKFWAHKNHTFQINGFILSSSPDLYNLFVLPQVSNQTAEYTNKTANGISFGYKANTQHINATFNAYKTNINNQIKNTPYFDEVLDIRGTVSLEGLNQVHEGIELGVEYKLNRHITLNFAGAYGKYYYNSRPSTKLFLKYLSEPIVVDETSYVKGFRIPNIPQTLFGIGMKYQTPNNLFFEIRGNYYDNIYSAFSFESRTDQSISNITLPESQVNDLMKQTKLAGGATLDFTFGKTWSVFNGHYIILNILVSNALDNQNIVIGGFEPSGYLAEFRLMSQNKYMYMYGRNMFVSLTYQF